MYENENSGAVVGKIEASDKDQNASFYYYIIGKFSSFWTAMQRQIHNAELIQYDTVDKLDKKIW